VYAYACAAGVGSGTVLGVLEARNYERRYSAAGTKSKCSIETSVLDPGSRVVSQSWTVGVYVHATQAALK
jgi:hypothetical protein